MTVTITVQCPEYHPLEVELSREDFWDAPHLTFCGQCDRSYVLELKVRPATVEDERRARH